MSTTVMLDPPEQEPLKTAKLIEELVLAESIIPPTLSLSGKIVVIRDLQISMTAFRDHKVLLDLARSDWPSVRLNFHDRPGLGHQYIPLNLEDVMLELDLETPGEMIGGLQSRRVQEIAAEQAEQAGLSTADVPTERARRTFIQIITDIVSARSAKPLAHESDDPPSEEFTVTTDTPRLEVLFATGYFIKTTKAGFGISTPATRKLPWGPYTFGITVDGQPKFSDTLWTVPDVRSVHFPV